MNGGSRWPPASDVLSGAVQGDAIAVYYHVTFYTFD